MKPLLSRLNKFFAGLFIIQLLIVAGALLVARFYFFKNYEQNVFSKLTSIESTYQEEVIFQTLEGNFVARDMIIYELLTKSNLTFAKYFSKSDIIDFVHDRKWLETCEVSARTSVLCESLDSKILTGIIPLSFEGKIVGYVVKQAPRNLAKNFAIDRFLKFSIILMAMFFLVNVTGLAIFFRRNVNKEVVDLLNYIEGFSDGRLSNVPHKPKTKEYFKIMRAFEKAMLSIKKHEEEKIDALKQVEKAQVASQVAHDVRSPLAALEYYFDTTLTYIPEEERQLGIRAFKRIKDIINNLSSKARDKKTEFHSFLVAPVIQQVVSEKRYSLGSKTNAKIEFDQSEKNYGLFIEATPSEFKRALSNILNNAIEATGDEGSVTVSAKQEKSTIVISVKDNGKGIPPESIPHIFKKGKSFDKEEGSGLGLYQTKAFMNSCGGDVSVESVQGLGSKFKLTFRKAKEQNWFVGEISSESYEQVVIIDDEQSVHDIWLKRLKGKAHTLLNFTDPTKFESWFLNQKKSNSLFLFDYEFLEHKTNGLKLIQKYGLKNQSILVTSHFEDDPIQSKCLEVGIPLLPKEAIPYIPIITKSDLTGVAGILIEDDPLVRMLWLKQANILGLKLEVYESWPEFKKREQRLSKDIPVFIDSDLGEGTPGEVLAQELSKVGFQKIYLETGHESSSFEHMPWITDIVGKEFPSHLFS